MFTTIWSFTVAPGQTNAFERHYRTDGSWATLFRKSPAYLRTDLLRDVDRPGVYVTIDLWQDEASYREFREQYAEDYARLDAECEGFTTSEEHLGNIEHPPASPETAGRMTS